MLWWLFCRFGLLFLGWESIRFYGLGGSFWAEKHKINALGGSFWAVRVTIGYVRA
jgi:hypothetical protein